MSIDMASAIFHNMTADEEMREMARLREKAILNHNSEPRFHNGSGFFVPFYS